MQDVVLNIDNKEILNEILHYSIDYLIRSTKHKNVSLTKLSHKFGFSNPDEFENAIKFISNIYRQFILEMISEAELLSHFAHFNADFQQSVLDVFSVRRTEMEEFLIIEHNSRKSNLLMSFDWDIRKILGTSNMASLHTQITSLILNCKTPNSTNLKTIHMELSREQIDKLITILEKCDKNLTAID
ncbi:uncharacterized protein LOC129575707 [Sitodiplosis mosellana]|uniref:uncharacterized protein LOC129575707 n=1 Tax=Sitodiplosis mosellana TaxID=263140 RepID=UPI002443ECC5|nr:uncharacterized protein LOC129575707 [Sitodiplosis mosellana]